MSLLTITSRHSRQGNTNTVIFHHSKVISRMMPAPSHQLVDYKKHGTKVTVTDLFGNMPVRVKHRALALRGPEDIDKEWEELKRTITALALASERPLKIRLTGMDQRHTLVLQSQVSSITQSGRSTVDVSRTHSILTQAGMISSKDIKQWVTMSASTPDIHIQACVSLVPSPTKQVQFISLGKIPIHSAHSSTNILYDVVNRMFIASDFGVARTFSEAESYRNKNGQDIRSTTSKNVGKGVNRWPMFYIRIEAERHRYLAEEDEATRESNTALQSILDVLEAMIHRFLEQNHLRPRAKGRFTNTPDVSTNSQHGHMPALMKYGGDRDRTAVWSQQSELFSTVTSTEESLNGGIKFSNRRKRSSPIHCQNFGNWSRIKSGNESILEDLCPGLQVKPSLAQLEPFDHRSLLTVHNSNYSLDSYRSKGDSIIENDYHPPSSSSSSRIQNVEEVVPWLDPLTRKTIFVNSRTGQCRPESFDSSSLRKFTSISRPRSTGGDLTDRRVVEMVDRPHSAPCGQNLSWLESVMHNWNNSVFPRSEVPISSTDDYIKVNNSVDTSLRFLDSSAYEGLRFAKFSGRLSKTSLAEAQVIAQVDRKYILIRMAAAPGEHATDDNPRSMLVLVDQHAADERCRIEQMFGEMFQVLDSEIVVRRVKLASPMQFEISAQESCLFEAFCPFFGSWGCQYEVSKSHDTVHPTVSVTALPSLIAERCRSEPDLMMSVLRGEMSKRVDDRRGVSRPTIASFNSTSIAGATPYWMDWISDCPEGIVNLLHSRACRSAVMFNDILSLEDCHSLISRLSRCAFPFQCAHGRPSMVPLLDMSTFHGPDLGGDARDPSSGAGFVEAFRDWKDHV